MTNAELPLADEHPTKVIAYYGHDREELLPFVPRGARRVLDVGCGVGAFGALVKKHLGAEVWGVEPDAEASQLAASRLDHVVHGDFDSAREKLRGQRFDLICFNDVLEHMVEPEVALRHAASLLGASGRVLASIPNFRYFPNLWEIFWKGEWEYKESGVLDATHLRFFTRKSMVRMFERVGYRVDELHGIAVWRSWKLAVLQQILREVLKDTQFQAFVVLATAAPR